MSGLPADRMPDGQPITIPGRGQMRVHDTGTETGRPPLVLLHGWNIDGPTNWGHAIDAVPDHRVIVVDHHGHGGGVRPTASFRLEHCAIDTICALDQLGVDRFIAVGYSMGGAIAQLLARRLPNRCVGVVTFASAACFNERRRERAQFAAIRAGAAAARRGPDAAVGPIADRIMRVACRPYPDWVLDVVRSGDAVSLLEAGTEVGRFDSRPWADQLQQPASSVITTEDTVVPPARQRRLADALADTEVFEVASDHDLPIRGDARFGTTLRTAVDSVLTRLDRCDSTVGPGSPTPAGARFSQASSSFSSH